MDEKELKKPEKQAEMNGLPETETHPMTEEEFAEEYRKLPMWQHMVLLLLFLCGMAAVIMGIDFVIDLFTELIKRIVYTQ